MKDEGGRMKDEDGRMKPAARAGQRYKRYPAYKDSGVEWLGEIPAGWDVKKIKRLCLVRRGASPRPIDDPIYFDDEGEYAWVRIADVTASERYLDRTTQRLSPLGKSRSVALEPGELFVSIAATVGKPVITKIKCCIHDGFVYFVGLRENREYLFYLFSCGEPYKGLGKLGTQLNLNTDTIGDIYLPRPDSREQESIVQFLDRETAKIDALVAKNGRLIELLQEQRTALITRAVTKGLPSTGSGQATSDVPPKDSGVEWLGEVARHWEVKRIKLIAHVGNGSTPNRENADYWGGDYPWLNSSVVNLAEVTEGSDFVTDLALRECHLPRIHPPAVLVGITGEGRTRGMATVLRIEATINQHLAFIRPTCSRSDTQYVLYGLHAAYQFLRDESGGGGSTKGALTCDQLGNVSIPYPPLAEQRAIAAFLDQETARIDALVAKVREAIERLKELRTTLISAAVTGKIDVSEG
jgi:type I restriction enzyme S subunit